MGHHAAKPRVGISRCLLGDLVRYDGQHKFQDWIAEELGKFVVWERVCPEVSMGLGVPRETVSLFEGESEDRPRMLTNKGREDLTRKAETAAVTLVRKAGALDGFILKKNSPSCGLERVKIYSEKAGPPGKGMGVFARTLVNFRPTLPVIEEGRLTDPRQRENFVVRIHAHAALRSTQPRAAEIQKLHERYKLLLLSYSPVRYQQLGRIAANPGRRAAREVLSEYGALFLDPLALSPTVKLRINVLQHVLGYFKDKLSSREKAQLLESIEEYRRGEVPFLVPLKLLQHLVQKFELSYLARQAFFEPYPKALRLA